MEWSGEVGVINFMGCSCLSDLLRLISAYLGPSLSMVMLRNRRKQGEATWHECEVKHLKVLEELARSPFRALAPPATAKGKLSGQVALSLFSPKKYLSCTKAVQRRVPVLGMTSLHAVRERGMF